MLTATDEDNTIALVYDAFVVTADGLCLDLAAPDVISISIRAAHASGGVLHLCVPRPDRAEATGRIGAGELDLFSADAEQDGCTFSLATGATGFGGVELGGFCDRGTNAAGFRMSASIQVPISRDCAGTLSTPMLVFAGTVEVAAD